MTTCDILLLGVGGQGVVTLGDLIARAALSAEVPVAFVPTKGMAQRGGFVKVEIRLGHDATGPRIGAHGADLILAMERSEALKGIPFAKPGARFVLFDHVWEPTGVTLGEDAYPSQEDVLTALRAACNEVVRLDPKDRPVFHDQLVAANIFALGALSGAEALRALIDPQIVQEAVRKRWPRVAEGNLVAFHAGYVQANDREGLSDGGAA